MKHHDISSSNTAYLLVFDEGDDIKPVLEAFLDDKGIDQASFSAVGALSSVELIAFDVEAKEYRTAIVLDEQCELANLIGNATREDGKPVVHTHATVGRRDGTAFAGHLKRGIVRPTCELVLHAYPNPAHKVRDERWGLSLYQA